jgi:chemotaxis protein methyltransferase CheR
MDLIVCRNVLMYFAPSQTRNVIGKLRNALIDRGWLAVSPQRGISSDGRALASG